MNTNPIPPTREAVTAFAAQVILAEVRCLKLTAEIGSKDAVAAGNIEPQVQHQTAYHLHEGAQVLSVRVSARLLGQLADIVPTQTLPAEVQVVYTLHYTFPEEARPSDAVAAAFATSTGVFNVWPYLREAFSTATNRLGFRPFTLGLLRPQQLVTESKKKTILKLKKRARSER